MKLRTITGSTLFAATLSCALLASSPSCKNAQQAENNVFTGEQLVCMVLPLVEGLLVGTPEQIGADIIKACPSLQGFTTEVVAWVNQWLKDQPQMKSSWAAFVAAAPDAPAKRESWHAFLAATRKGARVYPVAATDANTQGPLDAAIDLAH